MKAINDVFGCFAARASFGRVLRSVDWVQTQLVELALMALFAKQPTLGVLPFSVT